MWVPIAMQLSRSQLLKCCASAIAASAGFRLCAHCGQALVPGGLSLSGATARSCAALGNGALAKSCCLQQGQACCGAPPESGQRCQGAHALAAFNSNECSVFSKALMCLFSLLLLVTCKMLMANYLNKQCHGG